MATKLEIATRLYTEGFLLKMVRKYAINLREEDMQDAASEMYVRLVESPSDGLEKAYDQRGYNGAQAYACRAVYNACRQVKGKKSMKRLYELPSPIECASDGYEYDLNIELTLDEIRARLLPMEVYLFNTFVEAGCDVEAFATECGTSVIAAKTTLKKIQQKLTRYEE